MTTKTLEKKTFELKKEVELLRSFVVGQLGKDSEGNYKPSFVKKALEAAAQKPAHELKDSFSFLRHLKGK